jgi:nucleoside-diphosphate-sugar epimerase
MKAVLVTGAGGYLGARIAALYARAGWPVIAWAGELRSDEPFAALDPGEIGAIVHAAAITRFNAEQHLAWQINVRGTAKLLRFAERCPGLEALGLLSTIYASGLRPGAIDEQPFDGSSGFANHYERSKWLAEAELLGRFGHLPWRIFRIATVIADDESGDVGRHNAVHNTLKLLYHGLISLVPGAPDTPLYFVTGEFAAGNVFELMQRAADRVIYHLAPARAQSVTLDRLLEIAWQAFARSPEFARRRVLKPAYADLGSFGHLADGVAGFGGQVLAQAIASITPFARQLYVKKSVGNHNLRAAGTPYALSELEGLVRSTCARLVDSKWRSPCSR